MIIDKYSISSIIVYRLVKYYLLFLTSTTKEENTMNFHRSKNLTLSNPSTIKSNCYELVVDLRGPRLVPGIEISRDHDCVFLAESDRHDAFLRYIKLSKAARPTVIEDRIYFAIYDGQTNQVADNFGGMREYLLKVVVGDRLVTRVSGKMGLQRVSGDPKMVDKLIWRRNSAKESIGFECLYALKPGDGLIVQTPGEMHFLTVGKKGIVLHPKGSEFEKNYLANLAAAEAVEKEKLVEHAAQAARETASTFPAFLKGDDWDSVIHRHSCMRDRETGDLDPVGLSFFEGLFEKIEANISFMKVGEDGRWHKADVFQMHTFDKVVRMLPRNFLRRARTALSSAAKREHAQLPSPILVKFEMSETQITDLESEVDSVIKPGVHAPKLEAARRRIQDRRERDQERTRLTKGASNGGGGSEKKGKKK